MANVETFIRLADNSGVKRARCIKILRAKRRIRILVGDYIVVSISKGRGKKKFQNKCVCYCLVITVSFNIRRRNGTYIKFAQIRGIAFISKDKTVGNRLYGPIALEAKLFAPIKILKYAKKVI